MKQIKVFKSCKLINKLTKITLSILLIAPIVVNIPNIKYSSNECMTKKTLLVLQSKCTCNKWQKIVVEKYNCEKNYSVFSIDTRDNQKRFLYNFDENEFTSTNFTCDLYSEFRRGKDQKVISYTLFGTNSRYYDKITDIIKQAKYFYPDWSIRIYSDDNLNDTTKCIYECSLENNLDFCNVNRIPTSLNKSINWNASYIIPTMWRFLPMGDSFVKFMISRDSDSFIIQREVDAVKAWLESGKLAHIMRDHPDHRDVILAGMWGLRFDIDKQNKLIKKWWNNLIDPKIANNYNPYEDNFKESDQIWLKNFMWHEISQHALIHDSFNCKKNMNGEPWPTQRIGDCFVGSIWNCNKSANYQFHKCPKACRPRDHQNWTSC